MEKSDSPKTKQCLPPTHPALLLLLLFKLVLDFLRFIILYQPKDFPVVHHTLNELSL